MIDVEDCDARLPSSGDATDLYMDELVRLSIILGKVQKTIYRYMKPFMQCINLALTSAYCTSPSGLTFTSDAMLVELLGQIKSWKEGLPDHLQFKGPNSSNTAGEIFSYLYCVAHFFSVHRTDRPIAPSVFLCLYDVLEGLHENQLLVSGAPQIRTDSGAMDSPDQDDRRRY